MYLILCWSYLNHSLGFVGKKKRIKKKNRILNHNRNILVKNRNSIILPNRSALVCDQDRFLSRSSSFCHKNKACTPPPPIRTECHLTALEMNCCLMNGHKE